MLVADSQVHIWAADTPERPWVPGVKPHREKPLGHEELLHEMNAAGIDRVVIVPPRLDGSRNDLALAAVRAYPDRFAVMGKIDVKDLQAPTRLATWRTDPGMLGVRFNFKRTPEALASGDVHRGDGLALRRRPRVDHGPHPVRVAGMAGVRKGRGSRSITVHPFRALCAFACLALFPTVQAGEQPKQNVASYPSRTIRIILPLSAGGSADAIARMVGDTFASAFGQSVVVDNRPGANGIIGMDLAAKATPDGYTLLVASGANLTVNPALHGSKMPFDVERDLIPIAHVASQAFIAHVSPAFAVKSIKELIAYAKAKPGAINYASAGNGSTAHLMAVLFEHLADVKMTHVPYKGAPQGRTAVMAREVDLMFDGLLATLPHMKAGRLRGLGITSAKRSVVAPEIATIAEAGVPGYGADAWYGLLAPRGTPSGIVTKLSTTLSKTLETSAVREKLLAQGVEGIGGTPEQFRAFLRRELDQWGKVIREAGIRVE